MWCGDDVYFDKGKVLIAAANPDLMEFYIEPHDLVILGNRYESQLCAIEMGLTASLCVREAGVSMTIKKLAQERGMYGHSHHLRHVYGGPSDQPEHAHQLLYDKRAPDYI